EGEELVAEPEADEDIELDQEEEDLIRASLEEERLAAASMAQGGEEAGQEPLFERNLTALDEEQGAIELDTVASAPEEEEEEEEEPAAPA
ncbi:MAG: hypothetical protein GWO00_03245, partial [Gemmatimonadetes bacterium]|nr:hypothetical protein [Gemmatimonadota bacterium]NIT86015.1 hypothetical protein [Gemmatimonadota bacterium]NIU29835.1 hypothetical protein [Gemmatimonadota bacterium]NIV60244.1 hypothetical protein [Gemmatimonadota bacterium]NIW62905.1 hypothetical protein [Gemmatimonadota bacterium]